MLEYGLYGDERGVEKLSIINDETKAKAFLRLLDLTVGNLRERDDTSRFGGGSGPNPAGLRPLSPRSRHSGASRPPRAVSE